MAKTHGRVAVLWLDDQAGTCRNVSGDLNNVAFNRSKNQPETTTFGDRDTQREVDGLRDAALDVTAIFNTDGAATGVIGLLDDMFAGSFVSRAQYAPAGSVTGCPVYTGSMRLTSYNVTEPVDNVVTLTFGLALATGCMTQACAV